MNQENKEKLLVANSKKGTNQVAVGSYNERLVLQLVREYGELSKAEATRATGLSANAISVIFRSLEVQQLLLRGEPIRGRVGQPSVPLRLNPDAHTYVALKIGRRSMELAIVNFLGEVSASKEVLQAYPTPHATLDFVGGELPNLLRAANKTKKSITSMAVAMPFELWHWTDDFDAPAEEMQAWKEFDAKRDLGKLVPWDIVVENDATAACRAEVTFGSHITELAKLRDEARDKKAWSAAVNAEVARGKAAGLYIEQKIIRTGKLEDLSTEELESRMKQIIDDYSPILEGVEIEELKDKVRKEPKQLKQESEEEPSLN